MHVLDFKFLDFLGHYKAMPNQWCSISLHYYTNVKLLHNYDVITACSIIDFITILSTTQKQEIFGSL